MEFATWILGENWFLVTFAQHIFITPTSYDKTSSFVLRSLVPDRSYNLRRRVRVLCSCFMFAVSICMFCEFCAPTLVRLYMFTWS